LTQASFLQKNQMLQNVFLISVMLTDGTVLSKIMQFGHSKSIFYVKKRPNLSKKNFIEEYQFRTTLFVKHISALDI
jgi:hypothetical protein